MKSTKIIIFCGNREIQNHNFPKDTILLPLKYNYGTDIKIFSGIN